MKTRLIIMQMILEVLCIFLLLLLSALRLHRKPPTLPPGEWGLPIIGHLIPWRENFHAHLRKLKEKHGDIFCCKMGSRVHVFLSSYELIKEALSRKEFTGRPDFTSFDVIRFGTNLGIAFSEGDIWETNRKFAIRHLKNFGLGTCHMTDIISKEVSSLIEDFMSKTNQEIDVEPSLNLAVLNVIWKMVADRRYDLGDEKMEKFCEIVTDLLKEMDGNLVYLDFFPWMRSLLPRFVKNKWMKMSHIEHLKQRIKEYFKEEIEAHEASHDKENLRDFIDCYLNEMEEQKCLKDHIYDKEKANLQAILHNLFGAGFDTTASTLRWFFLYMATHQNIQSKAQQQIDSVLPRQELSVLEYRDKLPYIDALINDLLRITSFAPNSLAHSATQDAELRGFKIPKGTVVVPCLGQCHSDGRYWEKPNEFFPEHFIKDGGQLVTQKIGFLPYAIGRRQCMGKSLAQLQLFLFVSAILRNFKISPPEGKTLSLEPIDSAFLFSYPKPFKVFLTKRN